MARTTAQQMVIANFQGLVLAEAETALAHAVEAFAAASIALPATNEAGEAVLHGDRLAAMRVADYWTSRARLACSALDRRRVSSLENSYNFNLSLGRPR
jgi:hypothetical protein